MEIISGVFIDVEKCVQNVGKYLKVHTVNIKLFIGVH